MDTRWLKTFITAAKYENFRQTSEELFLTQPAITKHIKRLEEYLNIQLFERRGKTVHLTLAGYKFLPYAKGILVKYEQGLDEFETWKQGYHRKLTIATAPQIASSFLPSILRSFMDKNPDIEVIINVVKSYEIGNIVSTGKADIGLSRLQPVETNIKTEIIHKDPVILVAPNQLNEKEYIHDEHGVLQKYRLITHNHPDYWDKLLNDIKRHFPKVKTMVVNQVEVTKRFIEMGLGVSYLPITVVREELNENKYSEIKSKKINLPFSFTYLITKFESIEVINFIEFFREAVSRN